MGQGRADRGRAAGATSAVFARPPPAEDGRWLKIARQGGSRRCERRRRGLIDRDAWSEIIILNANLIGS